MSWSWLVALPPRLRQGGGREGRATHPSTRYPLPTYTHYPPTYPPPTLHPELITFIATGSLYESNYWGAVHHKGAGEPGCVGGCVAR